MRYDSTCDETFLFIGGGHVGGELVLSIVVSFFFFFQAEDGIRDLTVTGVQTCALPIYRLPSVQAAPQAAAGRPGRPDRDRARHWLPAMALGLRPNRIWVRFGLWITATVLSTIALLAIGVLVFSEIQYRDFYSSLPPAVQIELDELNAQSLEDSRSEER